MSDSPPKQDRPGREKCSEALRALTNMRLQQVDINAHIEAMRNESDRGVLILGATLIEDALRTRLDVALPGMNSTERGKMFGPDGPLGPFARKVAVGQAMGVYDRPYAAMLNLIRDIRNAAAHAQSPLDFETIEVRQALASLLPPIEGDDFFTWPRKDQRNFYLQLCGITADQIVGHREGEAPETMGLWRMLQASDLDAPAPSQNTQSEQ